MSLIRKYARLFAVSAILAAIIAVPFLLPADPDSPVFRSGTFALLLMLACFHPLTHVCRHADGRTLLSAAIFGLLFSTALSLGAELRFYGGLLPGMGSMVRRLAVPLLAAPLHGGLAARVMLIHPRAGKSLNWPLPAYMAILLLCWLPLLAAYCPGMFNYDFHTEYQQFLSGTWDARHPLLYIAITYPLYGLGRALGNPSLGILIVTILRMVAFAAALSYSCVFVQRRNAPAGASLLMLAAYGLLPVFSVMAISSTKDTPFASALLVLSLLSFSLLEDPKAFFSSKRRSIAFIILAVLTCHMRKNGIAALLMLAVLVFVGRSCRRQTAALCVSAAFACALVGFGLQIALHPVEQPSFQTYSLPAQQLVRAYHLGDMTEEEKEELRSWYVDSDWGLQLLPHLADAAKGSLDPEKLDRNGAAFMDLWARVGKRNVRVYIEAFLLLNMGLWYPDDDSHAVIYQPYGLDKGYLQTDEYDLSEYGIEKINRFPAVQAFYDRICRRNAYQEYPVISQLLCTASPLWIILLACALFTARKKTYLLGASSGSLALWISYLLGPCTLARYMLPLFCLAPALFIVAYFEKE